MTEEIPEDLRPISNTKQLEIELSKLGLSVLGFHWTVAEDSLQVCRGISKKDGTQITQRKMLSLVDSVFDPLIFCTMQCSHEMTLEKILDQKWTTL